MASGVDVKRLAKLLDDNLFDMNWFSFELGGGWGSRLTKYDQSGAARGTFTPGINNEVSIIQVYKKLQNGDFSDIAGLYVGVLCFLGEKIWDNLEFVEKTPKMSINKVVAGLQCPEKYKKHVYEICHSKYDFIDFVNAAEKLEKTHFDAKSAISVYKMQGDRAIFPLLCQMFYQNRGIDCISPCLISQLPVHFDIEVSNYLSGCHFPVVVSPACSEFEWRENANGHFLYGHYGKNWGVLDVANVGRFNLSNYALANRLNYLGGGGEAVPYLVCWNWGDIIDAYRHFDSDLLVRDLSNDFFHHYWFNFGLDSLLNVRFKHGMFNFDKNLKVKPNFDGSLISVDKNAGAYLLVNLRGDFVNYCDKKDVFYSDSEVFDWFEIAKAIK